MTKKSEKIEIERDASSFMNLDNPSRRKAVKTIVGSTAALAAYNMLPAKWDTPIIESIFLPAHAQTSGSGIIENLAVQYIDGDETTGTVVINISGQVTPPVAGQSVVLTITP